MGFLEEDQVEEEDSLVEDLVEVDSLVARQEEEDIKMFLFLKGLPSTEDQWWRMHRLEI